MQCQRRGLQVQGWPWIFVRLFAPFVNCEGVVVSGMGKTTLSTAGSSSKCRSVVEEKLDVDTPCPSWADSRGFGGGVGTVARFLQSGGSRSSSKGSSITDGKKTCDTTMDNEWMKDGSITCFGGRKNLLQVSQPSTSTGKTTAENSCQKPRPLRSGTRQV